MGNYFSNRTSIQEIKDANVHFDNYNNVMKEYTLKVKRNYDLLKNEPIHISKKKGYTPLLETIPE